MNLRLNLRLHLTEWKKESCKLLLCALIVEVLCYIYIYDVVNRVCGLGHVQSAAMMLLMVFM